MKQIEHVVVLMMENRSFDSMLGWLYENNDPDNNIPELRSGERRFEGLQGIDLQPFENVDDSGTIKERPAKGAHGLNVPNIAPGEEFEQVTTQLFSLDAAALKAKKYPKSTDVPSMKGYVKDYVRVLDKHGFDDAMKKRWAGQVMQSHLPSQLPVLNGLAAHYAVCDMWFSSVPSQTNPNRAFAYCGTSMGLTDNGFLEESPYAPDIERVVGYKLGDDRFRTKTIFNALAEGGTTWKVFHEGGMLQSNIEKMSAVVLAALNTATIAPGGAVLSPLTIAADVLLGYLVECSSPRTESCYTYRLFPEIQNIPDAKSHFGKLDEFHAAARAGGLPAFTFIEPDWTIGERGTGEARLLQKCLFHQGNDYHPPGNLDAGENFIKQIYLSLIENRQAWEKTLFIIMFDEPVGSFDHVPPPAAIPPWGKDKAPAFALQHDFPFDRYGGRVPALLISPWIQKSTVFRSDKSVPFDHTSLIATILKWRGLDHKIADFGQRTQAAPTFDQLLDLPIARTDEWDLGFLKQARAVGQPLHYYERFSLKAPNGQYVGKFQEFVVAPFSIVSDDSSMSEYFPTLIDDPNSGHAPATRFYLQNADDRTDTGQVRSDAKVRLVADDYGLGSYNVLGAWNDSEDCYYFNDYLEGPMSRQQTWRLHGDGASTPLTFGAQVFIQNEYYATAPGRPDWLSPDWIYRGFITTRFDALGGKAPWTIVPVSSANERRPMELAVRSPAELLEVRRRFMRAVRRLAKDEPANQDAAGHLFGLRSWNDAAVQIKRTRVDFRPPDQDRHQYSTYSGGGDISFGYGDPNKIIVGWEFMAEPAAAAQCIVRGDPITGNFTGTLWVPYIVWTPATTCYAWFYWVDRSDFEPILAEEAIEAAPARRQFIQQLRAIDRDATIPQYNPVVPDTRLTSEKLYGVDRSSSNAWVRIKSLPMEYRADTAITYGGSGPSPLGKATFQHPDKLIVGFRMVKQPDYYLYQWAPSTRMLLKSSQDIVFSVKPLPRLARDDPHWSMVWYYVDAQDYQALVDEGP